MHNIFDVRIIMVELYSESTRYDTPGHAAMAYTQTVLDRFRQPGQKPSLAVLRNANVAITGARQYLRRVKNEPNNAAILAVVTMNILARITGDNAALRVHNKILVPLVRARGGVNAIESESVLGMFILQWESAFNLRTGTDPEILFRDARPPAILSFSPISIELQTLVDQLPMGFRRLQSHSSVYTLEVLVRTARVAESGSLKSLPDTPARYRDFWEACPCLMVRDPPSEPNLEKLVVQALILYCFFTFPESRVASMAFAGLRTTLGASIVDRVGGNDDERAALVWCRMCLIESWTDSRRRLLPEGWLLVTQMRHTFPEIEDAEEVLSKLRLFFSSKEFEERCRGYWDEPQAGENLSMRP